MASSDSDDMDEEEEEEEEEEGPSTGGKRKRKRCRSGGGSRKMMAFFEGLVKQLMEKQEAMQERFLEVIEKREQDRMIREEAWKRQEMVRMTREHEMLAQERSMSASRDAAIIAFLQKLTGQTIQLPHLVAIQAVSQPQVVHLEPQQQPPPPTSATPQSQIQQQQELQQQQQQSRQPQNTESYDTPAQTSTEIAVASQPQQQQLHEQQQQHEMSSGLEPLSSSRWPKSEVLALIKIRSGMESKYQEAGPKGPLWEEIASEMKRLGFNRSAKRCKEKWENINKYFKKVKESNKKRPEDAKTCPYFHQLEALYKKKILGGGGSSSSLTQQTRQGQESSPNTNTQQGSNILAIMPPPQLQPQLETENKSSGDTVGSSECGNSSQVPTSNGGGFPQSFFEEGPSKKPEDIVKELLEQQAVMGEQESEELDQDEHEEDNDDGDDDDDDDGNGEDDINMAYRIQFQRQNPNPSNGANPASSFLAIVQ